MTGEHIAHRNGVRAEDAKGHLRELDAVALGANDLDHADRLLCARHLLLLLVEAQLGSDEGVVVDMTPDVPRGEVEKEKARQIFRQTVA